MLDSRCEFRWCHAIVPVRPVAFASIDPKSQDWYAIDFSICPAACPWRLMCRQPIAVVSHAYSRCQATMQLYHHPNRAMGYVHANRPNSWSATMAYSQRCQWFSVVVCCRLTMTTAAVVGWWVAGNYGWHYVDRVNAAGRAIGHWGTNDGNGRHGMGEGWTVWRQWFRSYRGRLAYWTYWLCWRTRRLMADSQMGRVAHANCPESGVVWNVVSQHRMSYKSIHQREILRTFLARTGHRNVLHRGHNTTHVYAPVCLAIAACALCLPSMAFVNFLIVLEVSPGGFPSTHSNAGQYIRIYPI